jgi:parvulin-like peptidyl-prolyl isomerase
MGNDVLNGRSFSEVAKESSEGPTASQGGLYEWTTQGSLVSEVIDNAIFSLPVGELSAILDDHQALHIVRVLERSDAGRTPFVEAQVAIRMELRRQQQESTRKEYLDRLKNRTPIWTVFDDKQKNTRLAENPSTTR